MSNIPPTRSSSPAAQRMRRYRKQRRQGPRSVRILLDETDIDALIRMRLLKEQQRQGGRPDSVIDSQIAGPPIGHHASSL
jgi:hypothetical protein